MKSPSRKPSLLRPLLAASTAAVCLFFPRPDRAAGTGGLSLVPAASAQSLFGPASRYDAEESSPLSSAVNRFLKAHGALFFVAVPAAMLILYILIMGPADVWDSYRRVRRNRYGGFGSDGGFGGRPGF